MKMQYAMKVIKSIETAITEATEENVARASQIVQAASTIVQAEAMLSGEGNAKVTLEVAQLHAIGELIKDPTNLNLVTAHMISYGLMRPRA